MLQESARCFAQRHRNFIHLGRDQEEAISLTKQEPFALFLLTPPLVRNAATAVGGDATMATPHDNNGRGLRHLPQQEEQGCCSTASPKVRFGATGSTGTTTTSNITTRTSTTSTSTSNSTSNTSNNDDNKSGRHRLTRLFYRRGGAWSW